MRKTQNKEVIEEILCERDEDHKVVHQTGAFS